jgi:hypothetical protein
VSASHTCHLYLGSLAMVERLPLQVIATQLNAEGEPTLTHKGQWQKGTIGNLLAQAEV